MATITLRYEGGGHIFQERKINVEHREVLVGRSSEKKKPHTGNAIFSCLGIAREQAVLRYDNYTKRFYLRNIDASTGPYLVPISLKLGSLFHREATL